ncbi:hypothetical protein Tco_0691286 [Tanacetum coccineum]
MKRVNTFIDYRTELVEESYKKAKTEQEENDGDDVTIDATPLSAKSPTIVDYKIYKEGKKSYFQIIRADGTDNANITRKRSKAGQTRTREWKEYKRAGRLLSMVNIVNPCVAERFEYYVPSQQRKRHLKGSHWSSRDKEDTRGCNETHKEGNFCTKTFGKEAQPLTQGLPRWQSVCSLKNPTVKIKSQ